MQKSETECGAAWLAMALSHVVRKTSVAEYRDCVGVGRDCLTAQTIPNVARNYGLCAKAYSHEPAKFKQVPVAVVHWNYNRFVVGERWSLTKVETVDPVSGRLRL